MIATRYRILAILTAVASLWCAASPAQDQEYVPFRNDMLAPAGSPLRAEFFDQGGEADPALIRKAFEYYYGREPAAWPKYIREPLSEEIDRYQRQIEYDKRKERYKPEKFEKEEAIIRDPYLGIPLQDLRIPRAFLDCFMTGLLEYKACRSSWSSPPCGHDRLCKAEAVLASRKPSLASWMWHAKIGRERYEYPEGIPDFDSIGNLIGVEKLVEKGIAGCSRTFECRPSWAKPDAKDAPTYRIVFPDNTIQSSKDPSKSKAVESWIVMGAIPEPRTGEGKFVKRWNEAVAFTRESPVLAAGAEYVMTSRYNKEYYFNEGESGSYLYQYPFQIWQGQTSVIHLFPQRLPLDVLHIVFRFPYYVPEETQKEMAAMIETAVASRIGAWFDGAKPDEPSAQAEKTRPVPEITASCNPGEVKADGESRVKVQARLFMRNGSRKQGIAGKRLTFAIVMQGRDRPGKLSAAEAATDTDGRVSVDLTAPDAKDLDNRRIVSTAVTVACAELKVEDLAYCSFLTDKGDVNVEPHLGGLVSNHGFMPADARFPVRIAVCLQDETLAPRAGVKLKFSSFEKDYCRGKFVEKPGGPASDTVEKVTDAEGNAQVLFAYASGKPRPGTRLQVNIQAKGLNLYAHVDLGIDAALKSIRSGYEGKGAVNAGEEIPLRVDVENRLQPAGGNLSELLTYWGTGGDAGDTRLRWNLDIKPAGNIPAYLLDKFRIQCRPNLPFQADLALQYARDTRENLLWASPGSGLPYEGFPRITPKFPGTNCYVARASLVDHKGVPLPDPDPDNNVAYFSLETGLAAETLDIFFLENPFGEHTPQARYLRFILGLLGGGIVLDIADVATMANTGDVDGLANWCANKIKDGILDRLKGVKGLTGELAGEYAKVALVEQAANLALPPQQCVVGPLEEALIGRLASALGLKDRKLVVLVGDGSQTLVRKETREAVPCPEGLLNDPSKDEIVCVKKGKVSVFSVPAKFEYEARNAQKVKTY